MPVSKKVLVQAACAAAVALALPLSALHAQEAARPEVGHALEAAETAIRQKHFDVAKAELDRADAVKNHTPYEAATIEQTRGVLAQASGDTDGALAIFRNLLTTEKMPLADKARMEHSVAALAFQKQDYSGSSDYAARAIQDGDKDPSLQLIIAEAAYAFGDYKRAYAATQAQVQAQARTGGKPTQAQLQMLASAAQKSGDDAGYGSALDSLAANYPDPAVAVALLARLQAKPGATNRYSLDIVRLKRRLALLKTADDYQEAAQLVLSSGFPGEASSLIAEAYARHVFGQPAEAARQERLKAYADKQLAQDQAGMEHARSEAADAHDGGALVRVGFDLATQGDAAGIGLIEQGVKKGGMARPEQAMLTLGEAYAQAGRKADAVATFRKVNGTDGSGDLAHLWTIALQLSS